MLREQAITGVHYGTDPLGGHYLNAVMLEGVAVSIGLAVVCLWLAGRVFIRENA